ncbi:MAG: hypothetical protein HS108_14505 [Planctomycetes bacterium]|nr:hypothetical protein [Planctomycetota bacterium]
MTEQPKGNERIAQEAKAIVALAFRNGPIENLHAGKRCPACAGQEGFSRITDDEMKVIMKNAVNQMAKLLWLRDNQPSQYGREIEFGNRYIREWDEPELLDVVLKGNCQQVN